MKKQTEKKDIYTMITNRIINDLEKGIIPWNCPWISPNGARSAQSGDQYKGVNRLLTNYGGEWYTFAQAKKEGGCVKKGEKATPIIFWSWVTPKEEKDKPEEEQEKIPCLRYYNVFEAEQIENIERKFPVKKLENHAESIEKADKIIKNYCERENIKINQRPSGQAFYKPNTDEITIPLKEQFANTEKYYSTIFHELSHSTGAANRLNREIKNPKGTTKYAKEELIAEISAGFILGRLGINTQSTEENNQAYINNWIEVLKNDKKVIIFAASAAEKATNMILGLDPASV
jgi:antirestriction protein ArdC